MSVIEVPSNALIALLGLPGSGKSTLAERHFAADEHVSSDHCRYLVSGSEEAQWATPEAFEIFHTILRARLRHQRLSIADATHLSVRGRRETLALAREADVPPILIVLDVPEALSRAQNEARSRVVVAEAMDMMAELYPQAMKAIETEPWAKVYRVDPRNVSAVIRSEPQKYSELLPAIQEAQRMVRREFGVEGREPLSVSPTPVSVPLPVPPPPARRQVR